jgi:adenine-specific DNA-methyltransferase
MNKRQLQLPIDDFKAPAEVWRPIHYLGSKLRLVEQLRLALDQVEPSGSRVVDLFAGSGTVSAALAASRDVTAVDIQEYSRVLCSAVLNPARLSDPDAALFHNSVKHQAQANLRAAAPLIEYEESCLALARGGYPEPICELIEHASMVAFHSSEQTVRPDFELAQKRASELIKTADKTTLILRFYGGLFFSYRQAAELDALLTVAHATQGAHRDLLLAAIVSTASEIVNTVGKHFAQPIRPKGADGKPKRHLIAKIIGDRETDLPSLFMEWLDRYRSLEPSGRAHEIVRADFTEALSQLKDVSVVYADPPYTRDHYSRFYHVLETMCRWDNP